MKNVIGSKMKFALFLFFVLILTGCSSSKAVTNPVVDGKIVPVKLIIKKQKNPSPTILLSHGSGCVIPGEYEWQHRLHTWGYNAVIIDHCSIRGISRHTGQYLPANLQIADRINDYIKVTKWIKTQKWATEKVGIIGFSRGGQGVLGFANESYHILYNQFQKNYTDLVNAVVVYYPSCITDNERVLEPPLPILIHHGTSDELTPANNCEHVKLLKSGMPLNSNFQIEFYENAGHGFDRPGNRLVINTRRGPVVVREYHPYASKKSFKITKEFLDKHLR